MSEARSPVNVRRSAARAVRLAASPRVSARYNSALSGGGTDRRQCPDSDGGGVTALTSHHPRPHRALRVVELSFVSPGGERGRVMSVVFSTVEGRRRCGTSLQSQEHALTLPVDFSAAGCSRFNSPTDAHGEHHLAQSQVVRRVLSPETKESLFSFRLMMSPAQVAEINQFLL